MPDEPASPAERIRVIGRRNSAETHDLRGFLSRNDVPFEFMDIDTDVHGGMPHTEEELKGLLAQAVAQGTIPTTRGQLLTSAFEFGAFGWFGGNFADDVVEGGFGNAGEFAAEKNFAGAQGFGGGGGTVD